MLMELNLPNLYDTYSIFVQKKTGLWSLSLLI